MYDRNIGKIHSKPVYVGSPQEEKNVQFSQIREFFQSDHQ